MPPPRITRLAAAPRAASLAGTSVPELRTTSPAAVFDDGFRNSVPRPDLNSGPDPLSGPVKVSGAVPVEAARVPPPGPSTTGRLSVSPVGLLVPKRVLGV